MSELKALVFDLFYEHFSGVIVYLRIFQGELANGQKIRFLRPSGELSSFYKVESVGINTPKRQIKQKLVAGEIGWLIANIRKVQEIGVGSTVFSGDNVLAKPLFWKYFQEFFDTKPNLFCNIFPDENFEFSCLERAIKELQLQDNGLSIETVESQLLGRGFRCGFIGMFQRDIFCLRLQKEFNCRITCTFPSITFKVTYTDNTTIEISNPALVENNKKIRKIEEIILEISILTPEEYLGPIKQLCQDYRGSLQTQTLEDNCYLFKLVYKLPFVEFIDEFNEKIKLFSQGYAYLEYKFIGFQASNIVKVDIMLNNQIIPDLSFFKHQKQAYDKAKKFCQKLRESLSRHLFSVAIQACIGKKVIVRENLSALKKHVTGNLYGGDRTRKMKLWKKQKIGKLKTKKNSQMNLTIKEFKKLFQKD